MTTTTAIAVRVTKEGFAVRFPFELKDSFKATFKSAKWNPSSKEWNVGPRSRKRLDAWIDAVQGAADEIAAADEADLTAEELARVEREVAAVRAEIAARRAERGTAEALLADLDARRATLDGLAAERDEARAAATEAADAVRARVDAVVSVADLEHDYAAMRRLFGMSRTSARRREYEAHESDLRAGVAALRRAGLRSPALDAALDANWNRPDRDKGAFGRAVTFEAVVDDDALAA